MRIAVSSDWHGKPPMKKEDLDTINSCDLLLLAGDIFEYHDFERNTPDKLCQFFIDLKNNGGPKVIMTPGNHDIHIERGWLDRHPEEAYHKTVTLQRSRAPVSVQYLKQRFAITCLINESVEVDGLTIFGTPWTPDFYNWAFMDKDENLLERYCKMPDKADIVLSHGPPKTGFSTLDVINHGNGEHVGSASLTQAILMKCPKYLFCGHIHSGSHISTMIGQTCCCNVSLLDEAYNQYYPVYVLEL